MISLRAGVFLTVAILQLLMDSQDLFYDLVLGPGALTAGPCISRQDMPHIRSPCQLKTALSPEPQHSDTRTEIRRAVEECKSSSLTLGRVDTVLASTLRVDKTHLPETDALAVVCRRDPVRLMFDDGDRDQGVDLGLLRLFGDEIRVHGPRRRAHVWTDEPQCGNDRENAADHLAKPSPFIHLSTVSRPKASALAQHNGQSSEAKPPPSR